MKRTLLAATAIVACGAVVSGSAAAAEKIKLGLGGFMEQWFGYVDEDQEGATSVDQKSDSEWYIRGSTKLDNGIEISVKWEVEGEHEDFDGNESAYDEGPTASITGSFGRIDLGPNDVASENLGYGPVSVGAVGINKNDAADWLAMTGNSAITTYNLDIGMDDTHMVTYYTPRIAGFQVGASYVPNVESAGESRVTEAANAHNGFSFGGNWVGKFGGFGLALSAGYAFAEDQDTGNQGDDRDGWSVGGQVTFGAFGVHAAYIVESDIGTQVGDDKGFSASVTYTMGANKFSLGGMWSEGSNNTVGGAGGIAEDEFRLYELGYTRVLGPGVDWASSLAWTEFDEGNAGATTDNDGWIAVTGLRLSF